LSVGGRARGVEPEELENASKVNSGKVAVAAGASEPIKYLFVTSRLSVAVVLVLVLLLLLLLLSPSSVWRVGNVY
jgi:hypothetical protein